MLLVVGKSRTGILLFSGLHPSVIVVLVEGMLMFVASIRLVLKLSKTRSRPFMALVCENR